MRSRTPQLLTMCAAAWLCGLFVLAGMRVQAQRLSRTVCEKLQSESPRRTVDLENQGLIIDRDCGLRQRECTSLSIVHLKFAPCNRHGTSFTLQPTSVIACIHHSRH